ncbi:(2Fe-2S)-binding protein [Pseudonocardia sp. HH130630-07]|uniref:(2Fe-2S)-binding protein n=1 Tax=Pseudonocardia sp. HH130630-07 TaxID=1690815 RepID=UPI000839B977|nr:(2Fe-2S)-binding protein [Pseudonocardia sp. HH130630-07]
MRDRDVARVLADVGRIGPWFAVGPVPPGSTPVRWDALYGPARADGPDALSERIDGVAAALHTDRRIAASIAVQGLAARLVSMPFAAVACHGVLPLLRDLVRDPSAADPWAPLWPGVPAAVGTPDPGADPAGAADVLARELAAHLDPLYAAVGARVSVSERVLRGNAVSAIAGAARLVESARRPEDSARPGTVGPPRRSGQAGPSALPESPASSRSPMLLAALVGHPALRGPLPEGATGAVRRTGAAGSGWSFRRRSCCLYVRVPGGGLCGDCVLAP